MDERNLTLIVVPHGDLETRSFVVSYRKLKIIGASVCVLVFVMAIVIASWFPVASLAATVPALKKDLETLESERAKVAELAKALSDVEAQYERVRVLLGADAPAAGSPPMLPPLRPDSTTSEPPPLSRSNDVTDWPMAVRGFLTQTVTAGRRSHPGIDIAVALNSEVRAAGAGMVITAGSDEVYGNYIVLDHGAGLQTVYGHLNKFFVKPGDEVSRSQRIALSGSTGRSTASHLHFEVRRNGEFLDPMRFVRQPN
jgi:murein DD-endopeptidase MepM/ murein hydrolase activator NlpD